MKKSKNNKFKIVIIIIAILTILVGFNVFNKKEVKVFKFGNNKSSQEIVNYILDISSYKTEVDIKIISNKNKNKYKIKQEYNGESLNSQEILEPKNIEGVKIIRDENNLKLENSMLDLKTIFENYKYISDNSLDLNSFINEYKLNNNSCYEENDDEIIMKVTNSDNKYNMYKTLYIDKKTSKPKKMEIQDNNKNAKIYILYNKIEINSSNKKSDFAFERINLVSNI